MANELDCASLAARPASLAAHAPRARRGLSGETLPLLVIAIASSIALPPVRSAAQTAETAAKAAETKAAETPWIEAAETPWVSPLVSASLHHAPATTPPSGGLDVSDLDALTDQELIDLYITMSDDSLRSVVADQAALVVPGRFLVQLGYTFSLHESAGWRDITHTVPELLLRYRWHERVELRVAWAGVTYDGLTDRASGVTDWDTHLSDPAVGLRVALMAQSGWLPRMSVTVSSPLNVDSNTAWVDRFDPLVGLGYSWVFRERWIMSGMSALVWVREDDQRYLDFHQTVSIDRLVGERWTVSFEWTGLFPEHARWDGLGSAAGPGVSYCLTPNLQLDWVTLFGLDADSPDVLTQVLMSWQF